MNELTITQTAGVISYDFESTKKMLEEKLKEYNGAVFTEESKGVAKKTVAELRAQRKEVEKRIREVKKEWMIPFDAFEKDAKELVGLYDKPIDFINEQVKGFEEKRKAEKQAVIKKMYDELVAAKDYIPLNEIYNPKWENATYKEKDIREELIKLNSKVASEIEVVKAMNSVDEQDALKEYKRTLDVTSAINLINERAKVRADEAERERARQQREAEERIRKEERAKVEAEQQKATELQDVKEKAQQEVVETLTPDTSGETKFYDYTIMLTADAKEKLELYMDSVGIEYIER